MNDQLNSINSTESPKHLSKTKKFIENTKKAVRKALTTTGIITSTMGPMATTTTTTFIPASVNTISVVAPVAKAVSLGTAVSLLAACGKDDPDDPIGPIDVKDTVAPTINVNQSEVDITGGKEARISGNQLFIGNDLVASRNDNRTKNCSILLSINGKTITSGTTISEEGTLTIKVSDEAGNYKSTDIKLNMAKNAPSITVNQYEINASGPIQIDIKDNRLLLGEDIIASRNDDDLKSCTITLSFEGKEVKSGDTIDDSGTLTITITNKHKITTTTEIKFNIVKNSPAITVIQQEVNIFGGVKATIKDNKLLLGEDVIASRSDDNLESCKISLKFNGKDIKSGDTINEAGTLTITITNKNNKTSTAEITLTNDAIFGLENLKNASIQVDKEINILNGITFANGVELIKIEVETDGSRNTISDPHHYTPSFPGTMTVIFTIKGKNGNTAEVKVDNLTIKPLDYKAVEIKNLKPVDILPIVGQVERGDKQVYEHIEHLRVAEATRIRDMMWEYGAGNHNAEEYKQLMMRLNTGMILECPAGYNNYEIIGGGLTSSPSGHAACERSILNTLIEHANFMVDSPVGERETALAEFVQNNPNTINILGNSSYGTADNKDDYNKRLNKQSVKDICNSKNVIIFAAGTNIASPNGHLRNKIYNGEYAADEYGRYSLASLANSDKNTQPNSHLLVTIATNKNGDMDQTGVDRESSKYPIGFKDNVLFSGRGFPEHTEGVIYGPSGRYTTSDTNYFNVALADLCFQMKADVTDVNQLLDMIRSTSLTNYIRLDGQTQQLQLINPAGFFKKYLMPSNLPNSIESNKVLSLNKGYYKGVIFDIPGAEVKINGERIAYNNENKSKIKGENPMNLEWRLNGNLCKKLGYKGKTVNGKIKAGDDKWNGLNIEKDFSISVQ